MLVLVSYDVNTQDSAGKRRLRQIARHCENWGQRVQFSVFECVVDPAQWVALRNNLLECMDEEKIACVFTFWVPTGRIVLNMLGPNRPMTLKGR